MNRRFGVACMLSVTLLAGCSKSFRVSDADQMIGRGCYLSGPDTRIWFAHVWTTGNHVDSAATHGYSHVLSREDLEIDPAILPTAGAPLVARCLK